MPAVRNDRARLATLMNERRIDLGLRWTDLAEAAGISAETLRVVRRSRAPMQDLTKGGIEKGLQWERGSVDRILAGGEPAMTGGDPGDPPSVRRILSDPELPYGARMELAALARDLIKRYAGGGQRTA